MTLDVTIGKVVGIFHKTVQECPPSPNPISSLKYTWWTCESYRSGSTSFRDFFIDALPDISKLYTKFIESESSNGIVLLYQFKNEIKYIQFAFLNPKYQEEDGEALMRDRFNWFQYWTKKALELYGKKAAIRFS